MVPAAVIIWPGGHVTTVDRIGVNQASISSAEDAKLSRLVRNAFPTLESKQCPGTFPDESSLFITALGTRVTVRGTCEPGFTKLFSAIQDALGPGVIGP